MIDAPLWIRTFLITALPGVAVWAEEPQPPVGYDPTDGAGIAFQVRGGDMVGSQRATLLRPSVQFKLYGPDRATRHATYQALHEALDGPLAFPLRAAQAETLAQSLEEPGTGWPFLLTFYEITLANATPA